MSSAPPPQTPTPADTATPMSTDQPVSTPSVPATPAVVGNKSVSDVMPASTLTPSSDPLVVVSAFRSQLDASENARAAERTQLLAAQANIDKMASQLAEYKQREDERVKAEAAERDKKTADAANAKKTQTDELKLKLEASLQQALEGVQKKDPNAMKPEDVAGLTKDFRDELAVAGLDEEAIKRAYQRAARTADIAVRASEGAAARAKETRDREMADHISALSRQPLPPFAVSGYPVMPSVSASSSSFVPQTPVLANQSVGSSQSTETPMMSSDSGVYNASVNNIFGSVLGKRGNDSFAEANKRTLVTETVSNAMVPAAASIDFNNDSWMLNVLAESNKSGQGMPGQDLLRRGGAQWVGKHVASANGGMVLQRELVARKTEPYTGPISLQQLDPVNYKIAVETIQAAFGPNGKRPEARDMQVYLDEPSQCIPVGGAHEKDGFTKIYAQPMYM